MKQETQKDELIILLANHLNNCLDDLFFFDALTNEDAENLLIKVSRQYNLNVQKRRIQRKK